MRIGLEGAILLFMAFMVFELVVLGIGYWLGDKHTSEIYDEYLEENKTLWGDAELFEKIKNLRD